MEPCKVTVAAEEGAPMAGEVVVAAMTSAAMDSTLEASLLSILGLVEGQMMMMMMMGMGMAVPEQGY